MLDDLGVPPQPGLFTERIDVQELLSVLTLPSADCSRVSCGRVNPLLSAYGDEAQPSRQPGWYQLRCISMQTPDYRAQSSSSRLGGRTLFRGSVKSRSVRMRAAVPGPSAAPRGPRPPRAPG